MWTRKTVQYLWNITPIPETINTHSNTSTISAITPQDMDSRSTYKDGLINEEQILNTFDEQCINSTGLVSNSENKESKKSDNTSQWNETLLQTTTSNLQYPSSSDDDALEVDLDVSLTDSWNQPINKIGDLVLSPEILTINNIVQNDQLNVDRNILLTNDITHISDYIVDEIHCVEKPAAEKLLIVMDDEMPIGILMNDKVIDKLHIRIVLFYSVLHYADNMVKFTE